MSETNDKLKVDKCLSKIIKDFKGINSYELINYGFNSLVAKIYHSDKQKSILKIYPTFKADNRDRLNNEVRFLNFLKLNNIRNCPEIYFYDKKYNFSLLSFIDGNKITSNMNIDIEEISEFFSSINKFHHIKGQENLPYASEANFEIEEIIKLINSKAKQKIIDLKQIYKNTDFYNWFINDFIDDVNLTCRYVEKNFLSNNFFSNTKKIISQSDVGFHNMLVKNNQLFFIDFEYAGWDNSLKFISDWILQPDSFFPLKKSLDFFDPLAKAVKEKNNWKDRIKPYLLLYRIRWSLIIANKLCKKRDPTKEDYNVTKLIDYFQESKSYIDCIFS